ncbi:MAG: glycosyltransferase family 87 protein [Gemmatales bacterium]
MTNQLFRKGREKELVRDGIDGPLYPPTAALFFGFYGILSPRQAHAVGVLFGLLCTYLTAYLLQLVTRGKLPADFAALVILFFPHHFPGLLLGQNHAFTLLLLTLGWWLLGRGQSFLAGLVWGLFIYKPVFLLALALIPLSLLNLRLFLGMAAIALILFLATLPLTQGLEPWKRWIVVGQRASVIYELDRRWIWLSRDLSGMPRRAMWDPESFLREWGYWWKGEIAEPDGARTILEQDQQGRVKSPNIVRYLSWALPVTIALLTMLIVWRRDEETVPGGIPAAFLWMGTCWSVFHFMHYDLTMFSLPMCLLLGELGRLTRTQRTVILVALAALLGCTINFHRMGVYSLLAIPWESIILLGMWIWLAVLSLFTTPQVSTTQN